MEHISVNMAGKESYRELLPLVAPEARGMLMSDEAGLLLAVKDAGEDREEVCGAVLFCAAQGGSRLLTGCLMQNREKLRSERGFSCKTVMACPLRKPW